MRAKKGDRVRGVCDCHGVTKEGKVHSIINVPDLLSGKSIRCYEVYAEINGVRQAMACNIPIASADSVKEQEQ